MHLLRADAISLDETVAAVDLGQSAAELVFLSFTDSDLSAMAPAWERNPARWPSLRLANLAQLRHPFSVDSYIEKVTSQARFVLVRLLGGMDYWRYGVEELAASARARGATLAIVPGDYQEDARLDAASTLPVETLRALWRCFQEGGPENIGACLRFMADGGAAPQAQATTAFGIYDPAAQALPPPCGEVGAQRRVGVGVERTSTECAPVAAPGLHDGGLRQPPPDELCASTSPKGGGIAPRALILFYRSVYLAADVAPVDALLDALRARGFDVAAAYVSSLKDPSATAPLKTFIAECRPDVILNTTAFSARGDDGASVLDAADAPVLQTVLSGSSEEQWRAASRGLRAADLAMNVALPEIDGRILAGAISFKAASEWREGLQYSRQIHQPDASRIAHVADLASAWARLRATPRKDRRLACLLSDYPGKGGRAGYAVGLDTPESARAIAGRLLAEGYDVAPLSEGGDLMRALTHGPLTAILPLADYRRRFAMLPAAFAASVNEAWGDPADDPAVADGWFQARFVRAQNLIVALQPERGREKDRRENYHDGNLPPRHAYIAFYLWLREVESVHALIHCGAHGTLEWLPGKAMALSEDCAPEVVLGALPVIYPFIVNNPGEAAQAKRRVAAVTLGHLTPPLAVAGAHGAMGEIEALFDEYAQAQALDPRRAAYLAGAILARAEETGLLADAGASGDDPLAALDAWLCDVKEMRIGDGLHVYGREIPSHLAGEWLLPPPCGEVGAQRRVEGRVEQNIAELSHTATSALNGGSLRPPPPAALCASTSPQGVGICAEALQRACPEAEMHGLLTALDGRFVPPGPAGAPSRGRLDVLPTGRNLYAIDPRGVPTRTAWEIGRRTAEEVVARYAQDNGEWPRRILIDLWASASMRTGGDDLAQAFALIGVKPTWDAATSRVSGFEILPIASLGRSRVDVTLRISGLFRDVFPEQMALFDAAIRAVAALKEESTDNPLAERRTENMARIFGAAPGNYGLGLGRKIAAGDWAAREELGQKYLAATTHAYGVGEGRAAGADFSAQVASADAFVHVQDMEGQDILDSDAFAEHEGGFAAAAQALGAAPAVYHVDATRPGHTKVRTLPEEIARVLRGRATNPRWIAGQMRHGWRGAAEIAETVDNLFAYAALTDAVQSRHFDLMFDAACGEEAVRQFLIEANPDAARAIAARFAEAASRGFWVSRRNSTQAILEEMEQAA